VTVEDVRVLHSRSRPAAPSTTRPDPGPSDDPVVEIADFGGLTVAFDERVLRPRGWTVMQSDWARELLPDLPAGDVLELCAGVGHIGLRAVHGTDRRLLMVDASEVACRYAGLNTQHARLSRQVDIRCGELQRCLDPAERFALVIADPPWVPTDRCGDHPEDPLLAIDGGPDGLDPTRAVLRVVGTHLMPWGAALLQLGGPDQLATVEHELLRSPELDLEVVGHRLGAGGCVVLLRRRSL
jgi:methylase of polypeptide subunit release factors